MESENGIRVKITIGDAIVEIEGKDVSAVNQVVETVRGIIQGRSASPILGVHDAAARQDYPAAISATAARPDIKSFFEEKNPKTQLEAAATVAFFLEHVETESTKRSVFLTAEILMDELRKARFPLPKAPKQVLVDAKVGGYFDNAGTGRYRLNSVGYNLVSFALGKDVGEKNPRKKVAKRKKESGKK